MSEAPGSINRRQEGGHLVPLAVLTLCLGGGRVLSSGRSQEALEGKYVPAKGVPGPLHPQLLTPAQLHERHKDQRRLDSSLADLPDDPLLYLQLEYRHNECS